MLSDLSLLLLLILVASVSPKPIDDGSLNEEVNEIHSGTRGNYKSVGNEIAVTRIGEVASSLSRSSNEQTTSSTKRTSAVTSTTTSDEITGDEIASEKLANPQNATADNTLTRQQGLAWFLTPFTQKVQFSPQTFIDDRIGQLKNTLSHFSSLFPNQQDGGNKQFGNGGLVNLVGLNDSGFYTNRLDPVGFFGGNGWFANKGGILGGPGALISTGSLFTDYPTPYRK